MIRYNLFAASLMTLALLSCTTKEKDAALLIPFEKYNLPNGLTVILNEDHSDPVAAVVIYYHVGSSLEVPGKTGFAHLFEHMMFQRSENVGEDQLFKLIQGAGGTLNGGTNADMTVYYEVVPKNALELTLWLESDRMGYLENTVTKQAFVNQQNVVQNEKRQNYDNTPYGFNRGLIAKNLYPPDHPYSWLTIGEMEDLTNATVEDVKAFHRKFYTPGNATMVISGDINKDEVKVLVEKYFGEIPRGEEVEKRSPMPVTLESTKKLFHEDNLAKAPQLTMVFPTVEQYSADSYALDFLGELLAGTKKSPLHTILVKEKKLTSRVMAGNYSQELAGTFTISVTANPGVSLTEVEKAIFEGFEKFERESFTEEDLTRIKAGYETAFYNRFASVEDKAFSLGEYQMNTGDPAFYLKDFAGIQSVTRADVLRVFEKYIKRKNYVATSFVPKGEINLVASNYINAGIVEEDVMKAAVVKVEDMEEEQIVKTKTKLDRSVQPVPGPDPEVKLPAVWTGSLKNGMKLWGIFRDELPLVEYQLVIDGGHMLDDIEKAGVANLTALMMNEGTKNKTPEQLEDAIGLLGASISFSCGTENIAMSVSTLSRNFGKSLKLVEEMILEPRWDTAQFGIVKSRIINGLKSSRANPSYLASQALARLIYGEKNILSVESAGTEQSVEKITIDDLKAFYDKNFSPSVARFLVTGDADQSEVVKSLEELGLKWRAGDVDMPRVIRTDPPAAATLYFVDVPDAKQSAIYIGAPAIARTDPDFYPLQVANTKLGGDFNSIFNIILREEKGFTYGAKSSVSGLKNTGSFIASSSVRTGATAESVNIFRTEMEKYRKSIPQEYIDYTKSTLLKSNARRFETLYSLLGMLNTISAYNLPVDYIRKEEEYVKGLTVAKQLELVNKYIDPGRMYYVVAGDAKTQLSEMEKTGLGKPVLLQN